MKKPAIIDQEIEFKIFCHSVLIPPHEVEDYDPKDPADVKYAMAMDFITEGRTEQGKKDLEAAYRLGSWRAGNALAYGLSVGWFGERDNEAHLVILLVKQGSRDAMNNLAFAYDHGLGLRKSLRWAIYRYEKAAAKQTIANIRYSVTRQPSPEESRWLSIAFRRMASGSAAKRRTTEGYAARRGV